MNVEDGFEVLILAILYNKRDSYFFKYKANMHIGFALPIFSRGVLGRTTNFTIFFVLYLTCQSNIKDFIENIRKICKTYYQVFMNKYILGLKNILKVL